MARKKKVPTPALPDLDANRSQDTRKNVPTKELRDFVADDEKKPEAMHDPRDPSLDPQLVWKGKDEQDREPLQCNVVHIYRRINLRFENRRSPRFTGQPK
jgi:adenine-specific DNA-methyltransferase